MRLYKIVAHSHLPQIFSLQDPAAREGGVCYNSCEDHLQKIGLMSNVKMLLLLTADHSQPLSLKDALLLHQICCHGDVLFQL